MRNSEIPFIGFDVPIEKGEIQNQPFVSIDGSISIRNHQIEELVTDLTNIFRKIKGFSNGYKFTFKTEFTADNPDIASIKLVVCTDEENPPIDPSDITCFEQIFENILDKLKDLARLYNIENAAQPGSVPATKILSAYPNEFKECPFIPAIFKAICKYVGPIGGEFRAWTHKGELAFVIGKLQSTLKSEEILQDFFDVDGFENRTKRTQSRKCSLQQISTGEVFSAALRDEHFYQAMKSINPDNRKILKVEYCTTTKFNDGKTKTSIQVSEINLVDPEQISLV